MNRVNYFPGLDALRFFAALIVLLSHLDQIRADFFIPQFMPFDRISLNGGMGVDFFFVLSGFLITYLLLCEKDKTNTISLKNFYIRRTLRIWPLYYLILILGFFILPYIHLIDLPYYSENFKIHYTPNLILYLTLLPHLAYSIYPAVPHIGQSWSIGVEEQFYVFWPLLIRFAKNTHRVIIISGISYILIKVFFLFLYSKHREISGLLYLKNYLVMCRFDNMMLGAWGAYVFFTGKASILSFIYKKTVFICSMLFIPVIGWCLGKSQLQNASHILLSVCFLIIILNISTNPNTILKLNYSWLNYLGKISYGIYMYHFMIIPFVITLFIKFFSYNGNSPGLTILFYVASIFLTITVSALSYRLFESYFLKYKTKFESKH